MRQRLGPLRARAMARRPGEEGRINLGPRERRLLGWIAALVLVVGIAVVVGILGGNGDGAPVAPNESAAASPGTGLAITFGTAIDEASREIPADAVAERFAAGDTFAYSIRPAGELPAAIYVEVERIGGGEPAIVQTATVDNEQPVTFAGPAIGYRVPAENLLAEWGPGEYRMRIFTEPGGEDPVAEGTFVLVADVASSAVPSTSP